VWRSTVAESPVLAMQVQGLESNWLKTSDPIAVTPRSPRLGEKASVPWHRWHSKRAGVGAVGVDVLGKKESEQEK
jgi:hypothetical protein